MVENQHQIDFLNYLDGLTDTDETIRIEEHLRNCPACSKTLVELKEVYSLIDQRPVLESNPFLASKLEDRLNEDTSSKIFSKTAFNVLKPAVIVAAIAMGVYLGTPVQETVDTGTEMAAFEEELFIQDFEDVLLSFNVE